MKSRIQWCKTYLSGGGVCAWGGGGGVGTCLGVTGGQKVGFGVLFYCHPTPLRLFIARTLKLSQVIALLIRTGPTNSEFCCNPWGQGQGVWP